MTTLNFVILTLLTSFILAAYCEMENNSSEPNCIVTTFQKYDNGTRTPVNKWQTKFIKSCPQSYKNEDIIKKCENLDSLKTIETDLFTPITNNIKNITYMNKFCATCNNDNDTTSDWVLWNEVDILENPCRDYKLKIQSSEVSDLDKWTQTFISNGMTLESKTFPFEKEKLQCSMKKNWPIKLLRHVIACLVTNYRIGQSERLVPCQYLEKNGRSCTQMKFIIEGLSFQYDASITSYYHLSEINLTRDEYIAEAGYDDVFYLCKQIYYPGYWGKFLLIFVSVALLFIYLITNFNKRYFQIFSNQLLYIYSIGLIVMYVLLTYIYLKFPVLYVSFFLAKFFWTYHFFWTMLIFIVFSHVAFFMCDQCENITQGATHKCYLSITFVFGLVLPISPAVMYLHALETYENQCPRIPDHFSVPDIPAVNEKFWEFILEASLSFFLPILIFAGIFCILSDIPCDADAIRSAASRRNSPVTLAKMLLIMGIHYALYKICSGYYGHENSYTIIGLSINMDTIAQLSIDFHGVLVFFLFSFEKSMINDVLNKFGYNRKGTAQQDNIGGTETSVQFLS